MKTIGIIIAVIAVLSVVATVGYTVYALNLQNNRNDVSEMPLSEESKQREFVAYRKHLGIHCMCEEQRFPGKGVPKGFPEWRRSIEISSEFRNRILAILKSNDNTSKLLSEGYNVSKMIPAGMKMVIGGDGTVTLRVTKVVVELAKNSSRALVWIDVESGSIIKIMTVGMWINRTTSTTTVTSKPTS